jgi:hypothetical protein
MHTVISTQGIPGNGLTALRQDSSYIMLFEQDRLPISEEQFQLIRIESIEEAILFRQFIGESCRLYISPEYLKQHPDLYEQAEVVASTELSLFAPCDIDTASKLITKMPLDIKGLIRSPLAVRDGEKSAARIKKKYVHKTNKENILISEPYSTGWLHHFNMYHQTSELTDHLSSHVEGMLIIEATRQASTATAHLQGMPFEGKIALLNYSTNFFNYIDRTAPIIIRTYTSFTGSPEDEDKNAPIFIQVMQWGKVCAEAKPVGFAYMNRTRYERTIHFIEKKSLRNKQQFEAKIQNLPNIE